MRGMYMDYLYALHLAIMAFLLSIPAWSLRYLEYGIYLPLLLSASWILFDGCPLTKVQSNLNSKSFTRDIYDYIVPDISIKQAERVNTFILIGITIVGLKRLTPPKI